MNKANALKYVTLIGKVAGIISGVGAVPFIPEQYGLIIFLVASTLKDIVNRWGDYLDDGIENKSFKVD